ncbi:MAG: hypothetical protein FWE22_06215, partial [Firmicutes bacterium]|nr:hypothetical protein [Bacillota bacterium]
LSPMMITTLSNVVAISVGSSHSMALDADGRVWTWGNGFDGRLGHGNTTNQLSPMMITTLSLF